MAEDGFDDTEAIAVAMATQGRVYSHFRPLLGAAPGLADITNFDIDHSLKTPR